MSPDSTVWIELGVVGGRKFLTSETVLFSEVAYRRSQMARYIPSADADVCANSLPLRTYLRKTATFLWRDCNITIASGTPERIACVM